MDSSTLASINQGLDPYLFQVIGSTPVSIRDSLKRTDMGGKTQVGGKMLMLCVFAAAVNKSTMESFLVTDNMAAIRPMLQASFYIQNKPNMTSLTLLGHCLMAAPQSVGIKFVDEFRKKMGQNHLWDGNFDRGSVSDTQKKIFMEKQRITDLKEARLLGSCFFKWTRIDKSSMTSEEHRFWNSLATQGEPTSASVVNQQVTRSSVPATPSRRQSSFVSPTSSPPDPAVREETWTLSNGNRVQVPADLILYARTAAGKDDAGIVASIEKRGVEAFISGYREALNNDPNMERRPGGTVIGS